MIRILKIGEIPEEKIFERALPETDVSAVVREILQNVRTGGDRAALEYTANLDGAVLSSFEVTEKETEEALAAVDPSFLQILEQAASNIRAFHEKQKRAGFLINENPGILIGQKVLPMERVGLYVPGGLAAYPSTVLMDSIPAKIAGVPELVMVTPPRKDGTVHPAILAAAKVAGVDRIFKIGGAQAIAALAFGTESIPAVDKIVGPGNAYVAEAKRQVFGKVSIDMVAGPSEIMILCDGTADPAYVAADLLSQAEHDRMASAVLVTTDENLALSVRDEIEKQLPLLERREIARASIDRCGKIILAPSLDDALDTANRIAPEHLEICLDQPFDCLDRVKNAGSVFLGKYCPEALGDYFAGPNHTLPTGGTARFSSPLSVDDFVKKMQYTYYTKDALGQVAGRVAAFATQEGLTAHARSVTIREEEES
ncbi:MAG: histidinol dehydrogenase [Clostridia bacterium]|nr:histidinol dehydrogenase [Clostridia bacterium]